MRPANNTASPLKFPDETLKRLTGEQLAHAELQRITTVLGNDPAQWTERNPLFVRRNELLKLARGSSLSVSAFSEHSALAALSNRLADLLWPWSVLNLPYMYEGINETPGINGPENEIGTAELFAGGLAYGGQPSDSGATNPHQEKWWIHNWRNTAVFPNAPYSGYLHYRFTVDSECHIYRAPVYSGSIAEFVTIGSTGDIASSPVDSWTNWQGVGWPVNATLPRPNTDLSFWGAVPVSGSIPVQAGKNAALGFIYGTIISVASGYVQLLWANFGTRRTVGPSETINYTLYDKIEYRFEPQWWRDAVKKATLSQLNP